MTATWMRSSNLGTLYENGFGVEEDAEQAARWYRAAATRRVDLARLALARLQRTGALEPEPDEDQIKLLETAARRGLAEAQYELGVAYDRGSASHRIMPRRRAGISARPSRV